jgi:hypothetical protein
MAAMSSAPAKHPNEIHYVFLEGSAGVGKKVFIASGTEFPLAGKTTLTSKLQRMGYTVHFEGFVDLCKTYPPTSTLMTLKWSQFLITAMEDGRRWHEKVAPRPPLLTAARASTHMQGEIKDGVMFVNRSSPPQSTLADALPTPARSQPTRPPRRSHTTPVVRAHPYPALPGRRAAGEPIHAAGDAGAARLLLHLDRSPAARARPPFPSGPKGRGVSGVCRGGGRAVGRSGG